VKTIITELRQANGIHDEVFDKFFPTFLKTTGGIMAGTCQHGIVYYAKPIVGGESVSDACDAMITINAKAFVYDAIGTAVRSMNVRRPTFFGANRGFPVKVTEELVETMKDQIHKFSRKLATEQDILKTITWEEVKQLPYHVGLCDPLHIKNTKNIQDRTMRSIQQISGLHPHLNTMPHEQIWSRTKGLGKSINKMSYGNHAARFMRNVLMFNRIKNDELHRQSMTPIRTLRLDKYVGRD